MMKRHKKRLAAAPAPIPTPTGKMGMGMKMKMKKKPKPTSTKKTPSVPTIPTQTSFGGSLDFSLSSGLSSGSPLHLPIPRPQGSATWNIDFINHSTVVGNQEFQNGVATLQQMLNENFAPVWNLGANLNIVNMPGLNPVIYVLDSTTDAGILGYHDITTTEVPIGFVFALTAQQNGDSWTNTGSHELMELIVDPSTNLAAEGQFLGQPAFYSYECCDPVEGDAGYELNGFRMSNFVFPSWFIGATAPQYDFLKTLDAPFTLGSGGSLSYFKAVGDWHDLTNNALRANITHGRYTRKYKRRKISNPNYGLDHRHPNFIPHPHVHD